MEICKNFILVFPFDYINIQMKRILPIFVGEANSIENRFTSLWKYWNWNINVFLVSTHAE